MRITGWPTQKLIAGCLALFLAAPFAMAAAPHDHDLISTGPEQAVASSKTQQTGPNEDAGSPNTSAAQSEATLPDAPEIAQAQTSNPQGENTQPGQNQPQNSTTQPVGTAAAPGEMSTGVAASRPAGAVIAPAKQHRVRAILISVGVIVGAAVAIGTVVGLSRTSPSQPK